MTAPTVISVNISPGGIPKLPIDTAQVETPGIVGDGHNHPKHNTPLQAICLIDQEDLDDLREEGYELYPGATGENVTLRGLDIDQLSPGDRLSFSGGLQLEITKKRNPCDVLDAIDPTLKKAIRDRCGMYAKVTHTGRLQAGETVEVMQLAPE